jgi:ATP-dependent Clp endopeptidase proteolytic subunit ClpP
MVFLTGEITQESVQDCVEDLLGVLQLPDHERPEMPVLFLDTPGGCLTSTLRLVDTIRSLPLPIATYGSGLVASGGFILLMAGAEGHRYATDNAILMSHQFAAGTSGKDFELVADAQRLDLYRQLLYKQYQRYTRKSGAYIRRHLMPAHDVYMDAETALKHGVIDHVVKIA